MQRRIRDDRDAESPASPDRDPRPDRRRRPSLEGLEGRQLLSEAAPVSTADVFAPTPPSPGASAPVVVVRHTPLPVLRAWSTEPFDGVVASFVANAAIPAEELTATIDWGDGRVGPGSIEPNAWGGFNVRGGHTYEAGVGGPAWLRVDVADARTGRWVAGVEQRAMISRPSPMRTALTSSGVQPAASQHEPADRPQPVRLRFVERRQHYHDAADRYVRGIASADDLRYIKQVNDFKAEQNKGYFEKLGDRFVNSLPFT